MQATAQPVIQKQPLSLNEIIPAVYTLPALDKLRLIQILAEALEKTGPAEGIERAGEIFPFESGKTYNLATPCNSFGAADVLAEAMATSRKAKV